MGALDDAIREHLELKRRHGASDDEIKRAETEALGPARRGPAPAAESVIEPMVDEVGMPAPAEAIDAPPLPSDAVADAPPPPPEIEVEAEPLVSPGMAPIDPMPAEPESFEPVEPLAPASEPIEPHPVEPASR